MPTQGRNQQQPGDSEIQQLQAVFMQLLEDIARSLVPTAPFTTVRPRSDRLPPQAAETVATEEDVLPQALMALQQLLMPGQGLGASGSPYLQPTGAWEREGVEPDRF